MKTPISELFSSPLLPIDTLQTILMLVVKFPVRNLVTLLLILKLLWVHRQQLHSRVERLRRCSG